MAKKNDENMDMTNIGSFQPAHHSTQLGDMTGMLAAEGETDESMAPPADTRVRSAKKHAKNLRMYKALIQRISMKESEACVPGTEFTNEDKAELVSMMSEAEHLYKNSSSAHEVLLDSKFFANMSKHCLQKAEGMSLNQQKFHPLEFAGKLAFKMGNDFSEANGGGGPVSARQWVRFSGCLGRVFNFTPSVQSLYAAFPDDAAAEKPPKERAQRRKATGTKGEATKAAVVDFTQPTGDRNSSSATDQCVTKAFKQLVEVYQSNGREAVGYFNFVIDPQSFGKSVENMFYVSFLVKEGKVKIFYDEESGLPMILPRKNRGGRGSTQGGGGGGLADKKQVLVSFTMDDWMHHKEALQLQTAMIRR